MVIVIMNKNGNELKTATSTTTIDYIIERTNFLLSIKIPICFCFSLYSSFRLYLLSNKVVNVA